MKNLRQVGLGIAALIATSSFAQDVHFSQSEYAPGTLNPGMTGAYAPMQANINYRS